MSSLVRRYGEDGSKVQVQAAESNYRAAASSRTAGSKRLTVHNLNLMELAN